MKAIITGSTGMTGSLILEHCLQSQSIDEVISLVRRSSDLSNNKLTEVIVDDFADYTTHKAIFQEADMAFFCIGVYTGQVSDEEFKKITVDYAVEFAKVLKEQNPTARICLLSGAGADRTEKSKTAFGRYKGMAENQIDALGLSFFTFRPGYIYPVTPRQEPNLMYRVSRVLYPLIKLFGKNASIKSTALAKAMFNIGVNGADKQILENKDILEYV